MDVNLKKVIVKSKDTKTIKKIFLEAFPPNERPPYFLLKNRANKPYVDFLGAYGQNKLIGFIYIVRSGDLAYIFYFAVKKEYRGCGCGRKIMEAVIEKYKTRRLFLALEQLDKSAENYPQRLKRHAFYKSCGLKDLPFKITEGPVTFAAMGTSENITPKEYKTLMTTYLGLLSLFIKLELTPDSKTN